MANKERGEVEIEVNGRFYTWRLTTNAAVELETRTGQKLGEVLNAVDALSMKALRDLLWVVLQAHHAAEFPTAESVGNWIDDAGFVTVMLTFRHLMEVNQPRVGSPAHVVANPPMPPRAGTGETCSSKAVA